VNKLIFEVVMILAFNIFVKVLGSFKDRGGFFSISGGPILGEQGIK